uniref:Ig-like domain-containing protein n=1 Tax=Buteo japonicus TaxID=224669 RepID=A0A8C0HMX9_9AVES
RGTHSLRSWDGCLRGQPAGGRYWHGVRELAGLQHQGWGAPGSACGVPTEPAHPTMLTAPPCPPALPIRIVKPLRDKTVLARHKATLECTVSHARGRVRWLRGDTEIFAGDKYEICNLDCYRTRQQNSDGLCRGPRVPEAAQPLPKGWIQCPVSHQNILEGDAR